METKTAVVSMAMAFLSASSALAAAPARNAARTEIVIGEDGLRPQTLDVDAEGNIYVGGGREIWVYDKAGTVRAVWQFPAARPIRVAGEKVYVGRTWDPTIQLRIFDRSGKFLQSFGRDKWLHGDAVGHDTPYDLVIDPNGNLWSTNTHHTKETEARKDVPNRAWHAIPEDPNGGRLMFFDLKKDTLGRRPKYFGTFSNDPPEKGGPADGLHLPKRMAFDPVHGKIFVMDAWGVTRFNWPDGAFEKRIIREDVYRGDGLIAGTPKGTLYVRLRNELREYDVNGKKLRDRKDIDVRGATDIRVAPDGSIFICYPGSRISFRKYSPDGKLLLCRGLNVITLDLAVEGNVFAAGQKLPVVARVEDRRKLYGIDLLGLDEIHKSLWLRQHKLGAGWRRVAIRPGQGGTESITIPEHVSGAFELRLSASPVSAELMDASAASVAIRLAVWDPRNSGGGISICTDRNQELFVPGEWVRVNVIGRSIKKLASEDVLVELVNAAGKTQAQAKASWSVPANSSATAAFEVMLPAGMPPGRYSLRAVSPLLGTSSRPIEVAVPIAQGRFKIFTSLNLSRRFSAAQTRAYVRLAAANGLTHDISRYISAGYEFGQIGQDLRVNTQMRQLLAGDPRLPAPETAELGSRIRVAQHELSAHGMRIWPEMMGWELDTVNRTAKQQVMDRRNLSLWAQRGIKSAAQDGFLWNETNWWGVDHKRLRRQWGQATGKDPDSVKGLRWGGLFEHKPLLTGERLAAALDYHEYMAKTLYPGNYRQWKRYVETMRKPITGAAVPAFYPFNWPEWCSQPLDGVMSYHQVEQVCEPYMQLNDCAFMKHDGKPFWAGVEQMPDPGTGEYITRQLLPALLYGVEGFWLNEGAHGLIHNMSVSAGNNIRQAHLHQAIADLAAVLQPVGTRFRGAERLATVGVYYPRAAWVQAGNLAFRGDKYVKRVSAALIASFYAHLPAKVVFDEDLKARRFGNLKCLILPGLQSEITAADLASLEAFRKQGGAIFLGRNCGDAYKRLGTEIDVDFSTFKDYDYHEWFTNDLYVEKRARLIPLAKQLTGALARYVRPPVDIDDPDIWVSLFEGKDNKGRPVTYLVAVNQHLPDLPPGHLWKMTSAYSTMIPVERHARVPERFRFGYDLLGGKELRLGDGRVTLDFRRFPARVIALASERLTAEDLREKAASVPRSAEAAPVLSPAPEVDVFFPEKIHKALNAGRNIFLVAEKRQRAAALAKKLRKALPAELSTGPEKEDGTHIVLAWPNDPYARDPSDVLPLRLTQNVPGRGRAMIAYVHAYLPGSRDAVLLAASDEAGMAKAVGKLLAIRKGKAPGPESRLVPAKIRQAAPAPLTEDTTAYWGARLVSIRAAGDTVAVGAAEWGNNLFLLSGRRGDLVAATKAGRFYVDRLWISRDGRRVGAEALYPENVNGYLELFDRGGKPLARYARDGINSHENFVYFNHTTRGDIFSFALSPDGKRVYSSSNAGLSAIGHDGRVLWRHDYAELYTGLHVLRNKWAGRIDLTPDGRVLAVGLTHELCRSLSRDDTYRGVSRVRLVEAASGRIVWDKALEPVNQPQIVAVKIAPDGQTVAVLDAYHGLLLVRGGRIIRQRRGHFHRIAWSDDSRVLFVLAGTAQNQTWRNGILALGADGTPAWQYEQPQPIIAIAPAPHGQLVISDASRRVVLLTERGEPAWTASLEATGNVCAAGPAVFACDWRGNVYRFALADGAAAWKKNLTRHIWRNDVEKLPSIPYAGKTFGAPRRRPAEPPLQGRNVAGQAMVKVGGTSGWFGTGRVRIDAKGLIDGKLNDLSNGWLSFGEQYKAGNHGRYVWVEMSWPEEIDLVGLAIHEDQRHPEAWPYDGCLQIWQGGAWQDAVVSLMNPGPWHNMVLKTPRPVKKIRYCVTNILANNVWTDEIRVIAR